MKYIVALALLVALLAGAGFNLYADDTDVRAMAELAACGSVFCSKAGHEGKVTRTLLEERIEYTLPSGDVAVRCARAAMLFGPYTCEKE